MRFAVALIAAVCMLAGAAYGSGSSSRSRASCWSPTIVRDLEARGAAFERQTGLELRILQTGDAGPRSTERC